jgi:hypothetical protein
MGTESYREEHNLDCFEWNFFATSHGKGPVDGLGGALKRLIRTKVLSRKAVVKDATDFAKGCDKSAAEIIVITGDEIARQKDFLDQRWSTVSTLKGTQQVHSVIASSAYSVTHSRVSQNMDREFHSFRQENNHTAGCSKVAEPPEIEPHESEPTQLNNEHDDHSANSETVVCKTKEGDFVLISLPGKKTFKLYVGLVNNVDKDDIEVQFLKRIKSTTSTFVVNAEDIGWVLCDQVTKLLSFPILNNRGQYCFEEDLKFAQ